MDTLRPFFSRWTLLIAICGLVFAGCGGSDDDFVFNGNGNGNTNPTVVGITVTPATRSIAVGTTQQFTATALLTDGTTQNVTDDVTWTSSANTIATVSDTGVATAVAPGNATITASLNGTSASAALTVTTATITGLTVTPATRTITIGGTQQYTATATFSDGTTQNVSGTATWNSSNTGIASISNTGLATGVSAGGPITITASFSGQQGTASLTVSPPGGTAPVAEDDSYTALGNIELDVTAPGVLGNDTLNGGTISDFDATSVEGGTVALANDGSFTYTPDAGFTGADSFTYTLSNSAGDSTATVSIVVGNRIWFVDDSAAAGGNGTQALPFQTIAEGTAAAATGDIIYVFAGTYDEQVELGVGEILVGAGTAFDTDNLPVLARVQLPAGVEPVISGPVLLDGDNLLRGVEIRDCTDVDGAIQSNFAGPNTQNNAFINNCTITNATGPGINLTLAQPNVSFPDLCTQDIRDVTIDGTGGSGILVDYRRSQNLMNIINNDISGVASTAIEMNCAGSFGFDNVITGNTIDHSGTGGAFDAEVAPVFGFGTFNFSNNTLTGTSADLLHNNTGGSVTFQIEGNTFPDGSNITMSTILGGLVFSRIVDLADLAASNTGMLNITLTNITNAEELGTGVVLP